MVYRDGVEPSYSCLRDKHITALSSIHKGTTEGFGITYNQATTAESESVIMLNLYIGRVKLPSPACLQLF